MRPLDPRLLRDVRPARRYVGLTGAVGVATGVLVVAQAFLLAEVIASVVDGGDLRGLRRQVALLAAAVAGRALLAWVQERYGERAAGAVVTDLRRRVLAHAVALGPGGLGAAPAHGADHAGHHRPGVPARPTSPATCPSC